MSTTQAFNVTRDISVTIAQILQAWETNLKTYSIHYNAINTIMLIVNSLHTKQ